MSASAEKKSMEVLRPRKKESKETSLVFMGPKLHASISHPGSLINYMRMRQHAANINPSWVGGEPVAGPVDGGDVAGTGGVVFDFLAEQRDVLVQRARGSFIAHAPDLVQQG